MRYMRGLKPRTIYSLRTRNRNNNHTMDDFVPLGAACPKPKPRSRLAEVNVGDSLVDRCKAVVVANLERYPPEAMGILAECDWDAIVKLRHKRTAPTKGSGGIDGKGRMNPAITERYIEAVEETNPHLAESPVADSLVWKDCVEYKFRSGGVARPVALSFPWPVLVKRVKGAAQDLNELTRLPVEDLNPKHRQTFAKAVQLLNQTPMCLQLLQTTLVGKFVKKAMKNFARNPELSEALGFDRQQPDARRVDLMKSPLQKLEEALERWKQIAASSGIRMDDGHRKREALTHEESETFRLAQKCLTWRTLYVVLQERETHRVSNQGARMRQRRKILAKSQPKVVRVKPAKLQHDRILNRPFEKRAAMARMSQAGPAGGGNDRMRKLREETSVAASWQKSSSTPTRSGTFGSAVAFASGSGKTPKRRGLGIVALGNGKRMKVPPPKGKQTKKPAANRYR